MEISGICYYEMSAKNEAMRQPANLNFLRGSWIVGTVAKGMQSRYLMAMADFIAMFQLIPGFAK